MRNKIEIKNLSVTYAAKGGQPFTALEDVSVTVADGEFVCVIGSSGCGKSTLLSVLGGLLPATAGSALIDGEPVRGTGTDRGVVFQHYSLFPWMTAKDNIAFGLKQAYRKMPADERARVADEYLEKVGLAGAGEKFPGQLSGGMQQRVAIARALAMDTDILLMDEPFGAIDAKNRTVLQELLLELWEGGAGGRKTIVFVTHDVDEAILLADRIVMLTNSPGRVGRVFDVPFARPRHRAELVRTHEYHALRDELMAIFFHDVGDKIGGAEVVL
ncbi:MAG: ABC transporter ATP-binding protein [Clostridiales Family XIII bacterium]|jgi:NitT/TauT family transport system ATP-binding protein|nr:ABC transporter ATP-binding protein [Clostridiales Family XIII bacterium]